MRYYFITRDEVPDLQTRYYLDKLPPASLGHPPRTGKGKLVRVLASYQKPSASIIKYSTERHKRQKIQHLIIQTKYLLDLNAGHTEMSENYIEESLNDW